MGLFYHHDPEKLREAASLSALITHAHPLGKEWAVLQAYGVALAVALGPSGSPDDFLAGLEAFATHEVYRDKLEQVGDLLRTGVMWGWIHAGLPNS